MTISSLETTTAFPRLPVLSLETALETNTHDVCKGKITVIDFWTTRCTRCPDALDALDERALNNEDDKVQFLSICCDKLDGAREIIEHDDEPRWRHIDHYFMEQNDKEIAKRILGFQSVPFYVVLDEQGTITQMSNKVDLDNLVQKSPVSSPQTKKSVNRMDSPNDVRAFVLDDLDF
ncbi:hypothetical protein ACA910_000818 [Epithemia clementina (nom. ined.)]